MAVTLSLSDAQADELLVLLNRHGTYTPALQSKVLPRLAKLIERRERFLAERERVRNAAQ